MARFPTVRSGRRHGPFDRLSRQQELPSSVGRGCSTHPRARGTPRVVGGRTARTGALAVAEGTTHRQTAVGRRESWDSRTREPISVRPAQTADPRSEGPGKLPTPHHGFEKISERGPQGFQLVGRICRGKNVARSHGREVVVIP